MADRPSGRANRDFLQIIVNKKIAQQRALPSQYARDIAGGSPARGEAEAGASGIDRDPRLDYMTFTPLFGWSNAPQDSVYQVGSSLGDVPAQLSKLPKYISDAIAAAGGSWYH